MVVRWPKLSEKQRNLEWKAWHSYMVDYRDRVGGFIAACELAREGPLEYAQDVRNVLTLFSYRQGLSREARKYLGHLANRQN